MASGKRYWPSLGMWAGLLNLSFQIHILCTCKYSKVHVQYMYLRITKLNAVSIIHLAHSICTVYYTAYVQYITHVQFFFTHRCFDRFFRMVNLNQNRLSKWNRTCFITENVDLIGLDYLWEAILSAPEYIVHKPIELMKDIFTNLSTKLPQEQVKLLHMYMYKCVYHCICTLYTIQWTAHMLIWILWIWIFFMLVIHLFQFAHVHVL